MKRLTMRLDDGRAVMRCEECKEGRNGVAGEGCTAMYCRNMCKDRLAAYEETGLTPEQCENAKAIIEYAFSADTSKAERIRELLKADNMDAVKFIEEHRRMYKVTGKHLPTLAEGIPVEDVVKEVEEWSDAHPRKTRQDVFLEQYPETEIDEQGYLQLCPRRISADCRSRVRLCTKRLCSDCRREFWMQEVE